MATENQTAINLDKSTDARPYGAVDAPIRVVDVMRGVKLYLFNANPADDVAQPAICVRWVLPLPQSPKCPNACDDENANPKQWAVHLIDDVRVTPWNQAAECGARTRSELASVARGVVAAVRGGHVKLDDVPALLLRQAGPLALKGASKGSPIKLAPVVVAPLTIAQPAAPEAPAPEAPAPEAPAPEAPAPEAPAPEAPAPEAPASKRKRGRR